MTTRRVTRARSRAAAIRTVSKRPFRLLDALSRAPSGCSTAQLVDELGEHLDRQVALTRYGQELHRHEAAGRVTIAGRTRGDGEHSPSLVWRITSAGPETRRLLRPPPTPATPPPA